jgi:hypothetical protein
VRLISHPQAERIRIKLPSLMAACNPSVALDGDRIRAVVRTVNYRLLLTGSIWIRGSGPDTVNWLVDLDSDTLAQGETVQIDDSAIRATPMAQNGLEDMRLFAWRGGWWGLSSGYCGRNDVNTMILAPVSPVMDRKVVLLSPTGEKKEKNWVIAVVGGELFLIHWLSPMSVYKYVGSQMLEPVFMGDAKAELMGWSGSSQAIPYGGKLLACIHRRVGEKCGRDPIRYVHRLVEIDPETWELGRISPIFVFEGDQVEFNSGLSVYAENVVFSYGVMDCEAVVLRLPLDAVERIFEGKLA